MVVMVRPSKPKTATTASQCSSSLNVTSMSSISVPVSDKLSIDELTAIRTKENAAYLPEVAELMQALAALEKAMSENANSQIP